MLRCAAGNSAYSSWAHEHVDMRWHVHRNVATR